MFRDGVMQFLSSLIPSRNSTSEWGAGGRYDCSRALSVLGFRSLTDGDPRAPMVLCETLSSHLIREQDPDSNRYGRCGVTALTALDDPPAVMAVRNYGIVTDAHGRLLLYNVGAPLPESEPNVELRWAQRTMAVACARSDFFDLGATKS